MEYQPHDRMMKLEELKYKIQVLYNPRNILYILQNTIKYSIMIK
jgi:hypothetical protein